MTSPNLNYLIGIGAIVLYIDIYFFVIPSTDKVTVTVFCNVSADTTKLIKCPQIHVSMIVVYSNLDIKLLEYLAWFFDMFCADD